MNPIVSNNQLANLVVMIYPDIRSWMYGGISQMPTDRTKYHTTQHVETMLSVLDEEYKIQKFFQDEFTVQDLGKVLVAICWHDVVYVPGSQDNERKSADKWKQYAMAVGTIPPDFVRDVADMIISTEIGYDINRIKENPCWAILHDLDYISFASYATMVMNRDLLRNESSFLGDAEYTNSRLKFLKLLMDTTASSGLFLTPVFSKYNELATENILREYQHYKHKVYHPTDPRDRDVSVSMDTKDDKHIITGEDDEGIASNTPYTLLPQLCTQGDLSVQPSRGCTLSTGSPRSQEELPL